mgnify:FL=1
MFQPKYSDLVELLESSMRAHAQRPLFGVKEQGEWRWTTFAEVGQKIDEIRAGLADLGLQAGERVAIIADNRPEWAIAAYATYGLGAVFVPMYENQSPQEWAYILKDCGAKVAFVARHAIALRLLEQHAELPELLHMICLEQTGPAPSASASCQITSFSDLQIRGRAKPKASQRPNPDDIATFIYTSGTTGEPKGVVLTHRNLAANVSAVLDLHPMTPEDRSLSFLPWAHCFGQVAELHGLIARGVSMAIAESTQKIVDNIAEIRPTVLVSVPRIFNRIYDRLQKRIAEERLVKRPRAKAA